MFSQFRERGYRESIWQWWKSIVPFISNFYQFLLRASGVPTSQSKVREGVRKCVTVETCTVYPMISRTVNEGVASLWLVLSQIEQIMNEGVWLFDFPGASLLRKRKWLNFWLPFLLPVFFRANVTTGLREDERGTLHPMVCYFSCVRQIFLLQFSRTRATE